MSDFNATSPSPAPGVTCPGCGWVETGGGKECRSCGGSVPDRPVAISYTAYTGAPLARINRPKSSAAPPVQKRTILSIRSSITLALFVAAGWWQWHNSQPLTQTPGILAPDEPTQSALPPNITAWNVGTTEIMPLATFWSKARILHLERYRWDGMSIISPMDVSIGWGPLSNEVKVNQAKFTNTERNLEWGSKDPAFAFWEVSRNVANLHVIPSSDYVRTQLMELREGQIVLISGYLVVAKPATGPPWTSSLTREDTGPGSAEVIWVDSITVSP